MANPWFRLYSEIIDDWKIRSLAFEDRWHYVAILCLKNDGFLDKELKEEIFYKALALKLGVALNDLDLLKTRLVDIDLIDDNWQPKKWEKRQYVKYDKRLPDGENLDGDYRGYVYFIAADNGSEVKIGYSKNPWARLKELQTGRPEKLRVVATVKTTDVSENSVHEAFSELRIKGEWFHKTNEIDSLINDIKKGSVNTVEDVVNYRSNYVATTTDTDTDTDTDTEKNKNAATQLPDWLDKDLWKEWKATRQTGKTKYTKHAEKLGLSKLEKLCPDGEGHQAVIEQAIEHGWKSFYPLKTDQSFEGQRRSNNAKAFQEFLNGAS